MSQETWTDVDAYFCERLVQTDSALEQALRDSDTAGLPPHNVAPNQGKFLHLLVQMQGAKTILEFGTLGGYSTIWLARALPEGGRVVTLEANAAHAEVARRNIERAGLAHRVDIRIGKAADTLPQLELEGIAPFDFVFIDADKPSNPLYLEWSLRLARPGTVIIGDNVVRNGAVSDAASTDSNVIGVRSFFDLMAGHPRLSATALQTVGSKGYDGFSMAIVIG
ncbi:O-methyltransferase [Undibacterium sp. TJN25]|uniref:O-methyltransferase n=1 Tax=Undibacterium sp. TJN25 TaxID=3413056 RepID=UPI003BF2A584